MAATGHTSWTGDAKLGDSANVKNMSKKPAQDGGGSGHTSFTGEAHLGPAGDAAHMQMPTSADAVARGANPNRTQNSKMYGKVDVKDKMSAPMAQVDEWVPSAKHSMGK